MVSLLKNREVAPVHLMSEEAAQITAIEVKENLNCPAVQIPHTAEISTNDLTALSKTELCALMRKTADNMAAEYTLIERITAEAQRRASTEDHGSEDYWGDVDYFQNGLAEKIIFGHKRYKKCHRRKVVFIHSTGEATAQAEVDFNEYPNDLTALSQSELCALMRKVTDKMTADYELVKRITAEAQRRASVEDYGSDDYFEYIDFFQYVLVEKIIDGHKQYKKRHRFENGFDFAIALIKGLVVIGLLGGAAYALWILLNLSIGLIAGLKA